MKTKIIKNDLEQSVITLNTLAHTCETCIMTYGIRIRMHKHIYNIYIYIIIMYTFQILSYSILTRSHRRTPPFFFPFCLLHLQ